VSLIQVEGTLEAINKVRVLPKVKIFLSTVVAMSAQDIDRFHGEVTAALTPPEDTQGQHNGPRSGPET
jgi:hypothetical protein